MRLTVKLAVHFDRNIDSLSQLIMFGLYLSNDALSNITRALTVLLLVVAFCVACNKLIG